MTTITIDRAPSLALTDVLRLSGPARLARGVALLDDARPAWRSEVGSELDQADTGDCVLGQTFGDFFIGLALLGIADNVEAASLGFSVLTDFGDRVTEEQLTVLWAEEVLH